MTQNVTTTIRITPEQLAAYAAAAKADGRSMASWLRMVADKAVKEAGK